MSEPGQPNAGYEYRERIDARGAGRTLLDWLSTRYRHSDAATWEERIGDGKVRVDDAVAKAETILRAGQTVVWARPPWVEPSTPTTFDVLYRDPQLFAVIKPAGLPTLPAGGFLENTLLARVRATDPAAGPLHRLGRFTSGIVLFARTPAAHASLSRAWRDGAVEKRYRTLAAGHPDAMRFTIDMPIGKVPHARLGTVHAAAAGGKASRSDVRVLDVCLDSFLADVTILTGRPHQIRIHLASAGHPLVGDPLYGQNGLPMSDALPGDPGYRLHATSLAFPHPSTGRRVELVHLPPRNLLRGRRV